MKEQKLYSIVMRHLSGIQKGIQHSHSLQEYNNKFGTDPEFQRWARKDLNVVVLQAVTTGQLRETSKELKKLGVKVAEFTEPDLDDCLTSITFVLDERIFDADKYYTGGGVTEPHKEVTFDIIKIRTLVKQFPLATN